MRFQFVIAVAMLIFAGCAARIPASSSQISDPAGTMPPLEEPFTLDIQQAVNADGRLHVFGLTEARASWSLDTVVLQLSGFAQGEKVSEASRMLADAVAEGGIDPESRIVQAGTPLRFHISMDLKGATEYQLALLWGAEAKPYLMREVRTEPGLVSLVDIKAEVERTDCGIDSCPVRFIVSGYLLNGESQPAEHIELGVGYTFGGNGREVDLSGRIPENEQRVNVSSRIAPSQRRPFRLVFEGPVSPEIAERVSPAVRVISAR